MKFKIIFGTLFTILLVMIVIASQQKNCEVVDLKSDCQCITHKDCEHIDYEYGVK
jgi:hypothetical protein